MSLEFEFGDYDQECSICRGPPPTVIRYLSPGVKIHCCEREECRGLVVEYTTMRVESWRLSMKDVTPEELAYWEHIRILDAEREAQEEGS